MFLTTVELNCMIYSVEKLQYKSHDPQFRTQLIPLLRIAVRLRQIS